GGADFGYLSMGLILEETGRTLTASPLLASGLVGAAALVLGGSETQKSRWLPNIAQGETVAALAVDEGPRHAPQRATMSAEPVGDGYRLSGKKQHVLEGGAADLLIVSARTSGDAAERDGITLFLVPTESS